MTLSAPFALSLLVPTRADLAGWTGVIFAALVLIGFGRLLSRGRAAPEAALLAGWGGAVLVLTLWGVVTPIALRWPAVAVAAAGGLALALPGSRLRG
ncbi:MAG TPA: hypothetical protein VET85_03200, partial [Stellaceae bacterium]|nr:hypothetical protein [Stellaceae bacterium]